MQLQLFDDSTTSLCEKKHCKYKVKQYIMHYDAGHEMPTLQYREHSLTTLTLLSVETQKKTNEHIGRMPAENRNLQNLMYVKVIQFVPELYSTFLFFLFHMLHMIM